MENKVEMDSLEMRIQELEGSIYGERRNKGGKVVKVSPGSLQEMTSRQTFYVSYGKLTAESLLCCQWTPFLIIITLHLLIMFYKRLVDTQY